MNTKKINLAALLTIAALGLIATTTAESYADTEIPLYGTYQGQDSDSDETGGSFSDEGNFSIFDGPITTNGTFEYVSDPANPDSVYTLTKYVLSDGIGNSLQIESKELAFIEYAGGKYGLIVFEWKVVGGEGKFEGATGLGMDRTVFNLNDFSYKGMMSGNIYLPS